MSKLDVAFTSVLVILLLAVMAMGFLGIWSDEDLAPLPAAAASQAEVVPSPAPVPPMPTLQPAYVPLFEPGPCKIQIASIYQVECGELVVPEDRSRPDGPQVRLPVAIFASRSPQPAPDPVIHLVGGPGGNLLGAAHFYLDAGGIDILESRDYILFNQRGTHYAQPSLECPGQAEFGLELGQAPLDLEERQARELAYLSECQEALLARGLTLAAYNSAENAADVNDLRLALGYEQVNLYGISYGTRLALTVMRDYPGAVRSVILDSVYPPQVDLNETLATNAHRAFQTLFAGCAADAYCRRQYPDLESVFYRTVDALNDRPVTVPVRGGTLQAWLDGDVFIDAIFGSLYRTDAIPWLPQMIAQVAEGNHDALRVPLEAMLDRSDISMGMHHSLQCREEVAFEDPGEAATLAADLPPQVARHFDPAQAFQLCASWSSGQAAVLEDEPVASDVPALVLSGQYDPITPPQWGRLAADSLGHSLFFEFPGAGHGVIRSLDCGREIALQFLADPAAEPDTSCLQDLRGPRFY